MQYDHYKDTCSICRETEEKRNKLMVRTIIFLIIFVVLCIDEFSARLIIDSISTAEMGNPFPISLRVLRFLCLLIFNYYYLTYIQKCIYIENQYLYIAKLEKLIYEQSNSTVCIEREYKGYNLSQPKFLAFIGWFYKYIIPVSILGITTYALIISYEKRILFYISILLVLQLLVITIGYIVFHIKVEISYKKDS